MSVQKQAPYSCPSCPFERECRLGWTPICPDCGLKMEYDR